MSTLTRAAREGHRVHFIPSLLSSFSLPQYKLSSLTNSPLSPKSSRITYLSHHTSLYFLQYSLRRARLQYSLRRARSELYDPFRPCALSDRSRSLRISSFRSRMRRTYPRLQVAFRDLGGGRDELSLFKLSGILPVYGPMFVCKYGSSPPIRLVFP